MAIVSTRYKRVLTVTREEKRRRAALTPMLLRMRIVAAVDPRIRVDAGHWRSAGIRQNIRFLYSHWIVRSIENLLNLLR